MEREAQTIPVRISHTNDQILVAAPMPGLEPQNISVGINDDVLTIKGEERGPRQHELNLTVAEWRIGPYFREISLGEPVNGALTNATYGNGVLILSIPKGSNGNSSNADFRLDPMSRPAAKGSVTREAIYVQFMASTKKPVVMDS